MSPGWSACCTPSSSSAGIPSISLRVGIPHYLVNAEHPTAVAVLQTHIGHVVGITVATDHRDDIDRWRQLHDEVVEGDPQLGIYVRMLEQEYDRRAEEAIPSADDLGAEFERFLRTQRDDEDPDDPDAPGRLAVLSASDGPWLHLKQTVRG